ncbi:MAG: hypothetical protein QOF60_3107 [Actinomycetota bacterium]|nr:hypothetical protein [Actinomycetota bacterium]
MTQRRIRVRGQRRQQVDLDKLAFALLRLVEQLSPDERRTASAKAQLSPNGTENERSPEAQQ